MFLKNEKDPTTKIYDDDDWIRCFTEAQEITVDIPEQCVTYGLWDFLRKYVSRRLLALTEGEIAALTTAMRKLGVGSQGRCRSPRHFPPAHIR